MSLSPHRIAELGVVIVAAGSGARLGRDRPKAFVELGGRPLLEHALRTVVELPGPGQAVLVAPEAMAAEALDIADRVAPAGSPWAVSVVGGGRERHESVRKGLDALGPSIATVLVHDAARPLTPVSVFERVIAAVREHREAVVPAVPLADTVKRTDGGDRVLDTVDRASLVAVQTPQGFPRELLVAAHESAQARAAGGDAPTDDAEVVQRFGGAVRTVPGSTRAHKLTRPDDFFMLDGLLRSDA